MKINKKLITLGLVLMLPIIANYGFVAYYQDIPADLTDTDSCRDIKKALMFKSSEFDMDKFIQNEANKAVREMRELADSKGRELPSFHMFFMDQVIYNLLDEQCNFSK